MKSLTRNEMKNVRGGGPIIPGCQYGKTCHADIGKEGVCGNIWTMPAHVFVCGCIGSPEALPSMDCINNGNA